MFLDFSNETDIRSIKTKTCHVTGLVAKVKMLVRVTMLRFHISCYGNKVTLVAIATQWEQNKSKTAAG